MLGGSRARLVNQGSAENGHPQLCVILPDAESGRDSGELGVEQLPTQHTAHRTAGHTCRAHPGHRRPGRVEPFTPDTRGGRTLGRR